MLVDQAIEMFEECIADGDAGNFDLTEVQGLLALIEHAPAYDVAGVDALLCALKKKRNFSSFMEEVEQHPGTLQSLFKIGLLVWMEGIGTSNGFLLRMDPRSQRTALCLVDVEKRGFAKFVRSDADMIWYETKTGKRITDAPEYILDVLKTTAYLAAEPKHEIIVIQQGREEKQNKRGTKVLKAKRKQVHTIKIDGVERVKVNGAVAYRVHPRGWHCRRHEVSEHLRHYRTGKVLWFAHMNEVTWHSVSCPGLRLATSNFCLNATRSNPIRAFTRVEKPRPLLRKIDCVSRQSRNFLNLHAVRGSR